MDTRLTRVAILNIVLSIYQFFRSKRLCVQPTHMISTSLQQSLRIIYSNICRRVAMKSVCAQILGSIVNSIGRVCVIT
jgi:hypothetical protein